VETDGQSDGVASKGRTGSARRNRNEPGQYQPRESQSGVEPDTDELDDEELTQESERSDSDTEGYLDDEDSVNR
jgi:hypothetical protein